MPKQLTLLLLSAGRRVALMECFRCDAEALGIGLRVLAVDRTPALSSACCCADGAFSAPACTSPEYGPYLLELCRRESVDLVVPTIDTELAIVAELAHALAQRGTRAVISTPSVVALARDKLLTAEVLTRSGIATPRTVAMSQLNLEDATWTWPLLAKPRHGSSSIGVRTITRDEARLLTPTSDLIVQEKLQGPEHTVNMFFDKDSRLTTVIPHLRIETRGGEVSKAETVRNPVLEEIGWALSAVLRGARGVLSFQTMQVPSGAPAVLEVNARFGGGYPIAHRAGAQFSRWLLEEAAGLESSANNRWHAGIRMLRYDAAVFTC